MQTIVSIYSCLETSGGQSSYLYFNVVHFFNGNINNFFIAEGKKLQLPNGLAYHRGVIKFTV
jgi:hypothetical protein